MDEPKSSGAKRALVLIVDDDAGIRGALERYLTSLNYEVAQARDGAEGLRMAETTAPSVILADLRMPVMDGHTLLRRLNELGRNSSVVMMSGSGDIDDAIGAIRHGAVDYLRKPWTLEELSRVVERARVLAESLDEVAAPPAIEGVAPGQHRVRSNGVNAGTDRGVAEARTTVTNGDGAGRAIDGVALVEQLTERATRNQAIPPAPVGVTQAGQLNVAALRAALPIHGSALRALDDRIYTFSEARGLAMRGIAEAADAELSLDPQRCQHAGLLLDVGALYLLAQIDAAIERAEGPIADVPKMRAALDARHPLVGGLILEAWGVDAELADLTHDHHATSLPSSTPGLWCAAALGGALAVHLTGFGDPLGEYGLTSDMLARCAYRLGIGDTTLRRLTQALMPEARRFLQPHG